MSSAVIIESIIKRPGGSTVTLGDIDYRFEPDHQGRHVAVVENPVHIDRLLSIREGFRLLEAAPKANAPAPVAAGAMQAAPVQQATPAPVTTEPEGDEGRGDDSDKKPEGAADGALEDMSLSQIREVFKVELGRNPSPKSIKETLIAQIEAVRAERASTAA